MALRPKTLLPLAVLLVALTSSSRSQDGILQERRDNGLAPSRRQAIIGTNAVTIPPIITTHPPKDIFFKENESIEMPCVASGEPEPTYRWEYNKEPYEPSGNDGRVAIQPGVGTLIFARPIEKDEGIYQCIAENTVGVAISYIVNLKIAILKAFPHTAPRFLYPNIGDSVTLPCTPPQSQPEPDVYWATTRENEGLTPIYLTDRVSIDPQGNLHIAKIEPSDFQGERNYTCIVHNHVMRQTVQGAFANIYPQGEVFNRHPPEVLWQDATSQVAVMGDEVNIKCIFSGSPTPRVTWERADYPMPPRKREGSFGQELIIENVQPEDEGKYECIGINDDVNVQIRFSFNLAVQIAPYFTIRPQSVDATEGDTAIMECEGSGLPQPQYIWQINHIPVSKMPSNPRVQYNPNSIQIFNMTKDDAQVVQCNITNKHGYAFANAYFNVLTEPPIIVEPPKVEQLAAEGQTINLTCQVFGSPTPLVVWKKGNEQLTGGRFRVLTNGYLEIVDVSLVDAGTYTCTATNRLATTSATGSLIVRRRTLVQSAPKDVMIVEETSVKFTCTATTDPEEIKNLEILWKKDGEFINYELAQRIFLNDLDNSLTISGTISLDTGKYTCVARNGLDSDEKSAQLVVQGKPDPPNSVIVECRDQERTAEITWQPGRENYAPVLNFVVQYNTSFSPDTWIDIDANVSQNVRQKKVNLSPYGNYTFRVLARNKIGLSPPSVHTYIMCKTDQDVPDKNPDNVMAEGDMPGNLVIYWTPMPPTEHNGPSFKYVIGYRRVGDDNDPSDTLTVEQPEVYHLVVRNVQTEPYQPYEVYVKARNSMGDSREGIQWVKGFTGEDIPTVSVHDFRRDDNMPDSVRLLWTNVDTSPQAVRGFFQGYRIQYWKTKDEDNVQEVDYIINTTTQYPRPRMKRDTGEMSYILTDLPPYSDITIQIRVLNKYYAGPVSSSPVVVRTGQGTPGPPVMFEVLARGATHFELLWKPPTEPNGILEEYLMSYQSITGLNLGRLQYRENIDASQSIDASQETHRARLTGLEPKTDYRIYLTATTVKGKGEPIFLDARTLAAGMPNPPTFDIVALGENHVEVHWEPSRSGNPGSVFFVQHRPRGAFSWLDSPDQVLHYQTNVTDLLTGTTYQIRVVAKNGEMYQAPAEWQEFTTGGISPGRIELATSGWLWGIVAAFVIVILIVAAFMVLKRKRDDWWEKKEREIDEQVRHLQAEDAAMQMGITNQYAVGSREELAGPPGDTSHASLDDSVYKDESEDDEEEDDSDEEEESEDEEDYKAGYHGDQPPQYSNLPTQQQYGFHPAEGFHPGQPQVGYHPGQQVGFHPGYAGTQAPHQGDYQGGYHPGTQYQIQDPPHQGSSFI